MPNPTRLLRRWPRVSEEEVDATRSATLARLTSIFEGGAASSDEPPANPEPAVAADRVADELATSAVPTEMLALPDPAEREAAIAPLAAALDEPFAVTVVEEPAAAAFVSDEPEFVETVQAAAIPAAPEVPASTLTDFAPADVAEIEPVHRNGHRIAEPSRAVPPIVVIGDRVDDMRDADDEFEAAAQPDEAPAEMVAASSLETMDVSQVGMPSIDLVVEQDAPPEDILVESAEATPAWPAHVETADAQPETISEAAVPAEVPQAPTVSAIAPPSIEPDIVRPDAAPTPAVHRPGPSPARPAPRPRPVPPRGFGDAQRRAAAGPVGAVVSCPYCAVLLDPPPEADRRCPRCRQRIIVKRVDGRAVFLTEAAVLVFDAERKRLANMGRWTRDRGRWLKLASSLGAPPARIARLERAVLSDEVVAASQTLYEATVERLVRTARRERRSDDAGRLLLDQALAFYRIAGSPLPPPDDIVARHREGALLTLRGLGEIAKEAALAGSDCCEACRADDGRAFRISRELRDPRLPHAECPKGLCHCRWDLTARDRDLVGGYLRRRARSSRSASSPPPG